MPTKYFLPVGWHIDYQPSATSSNDWALAVLRQSGSEAEGRCFQVGEQTKGRGRRGKQWVSQTGDGLYLSIILCPKAPRTTWPSLSFMASLAVYRALLGFIEDSYIRVCSLKWPNDILCFNRKLAGILLEASMEGVIVGCGINLANAPVIAQTDFPPIALDELANHQIVDPKALACEVIRQMAALYATWQAGGMQIILDEWRSYCDMKGRSVRIHTVKDVVSGSYVDIGSNGQLIVQTAGGEIVQIHAGDVEILRGGYASGN
jgi:BirA family biotin operon repressor/biotin-[acetyl-CoA-carboxylase] ligase